MELTARTQQRRAHRKLANSSVIHIEMNDGLANPRWVMANLVDVLGCGCGVALMTLLQSGSAVVVRGKLGENRTPDHRKAEVRWCSANTDGTFRAGLKFLDGPSTLELDEEKTGGINPVTLDCYEVMQLSPNADAETISRVYRMLALRYHPDNTETGNHELFLRLSEAYQVLSGPEARATYNVHGREEKRLRGHLDQTKSEWQKGRNLEVATAAYLGVNSLVYHASWEG